MSTAYRGRKTWRKKRIASGKLWVSLAIFLVTLMSIAIALIWLYFKQPFHIQNTDVIVDTAIAQTIGATYEDSSFMTRQEVLRIISDVFFELNQKGFKKTESIGDVIDQARRLKILEGDSTGFFLENLATKQEALVFIARSLGILKEIDVEDSPPFSIDTLFDKWARPQIEGLVIRGYFSVSEIDRLYNLREDITVQELAGILNKIVEIKTQPMSFWEFTVSWMKNNIVLSIFVIILSAVLTLAPSIITIVSFAIQVLDRKKQSIEEKQQKDLREGTICLAGSTSVGKSTLKTKMKNPGQLIYVLERKMIPTRTRHEEDLTLLAQHGEIIFSGTIIDVPGSSPADVLQVVTGPYKNKILLLVLAHTKTYEGGEIDQDLIQEQLVDIQKIWSTVILGCRGQLNKIVIFINKTDLLSQEYLPAQKHIYEEHIKSLYEAAVKVGIPIEATEGSSTQGENLDKLYRLLRPASI